MPEEAKMLSGKAHAANMNEAEYLRLLISQKPNDYPEIRKLLKDLINEVNHIGTNINQIVHNNNSALYMKADKALYYSKEHGRNQYTLASSLDNIATD